MSRTYIIILALIAAFIVGTVSALTLIGKIQFGYKITPSEQTGPTLNPNTISLNLGTIPAKSSGQITFQNVATLSLPYSYEVNFTLNLNTVNDFSTFEVAVYLYKQGETYPSYSFWLHKLYMKSDSQVVEAGNYSVWVKVTYTAMETTVEKTGTVEINVYW